MISLRLALNYQLYGRKNKIKQTVRADSCVGYVQLSHVWTLDTTIQFRQLKRNLKGEMAIDFWVYRILVSNKNVLVKCGKARKNTAYSQSKNPDVLMLTSFVLIYKASTVSKEYQSVLIHCWIYLKLDTSMHKEYRCWHASSPSLFECVRSPS